MVGLAFGRGWSSGGLVSSGLQVFVGRGALKIRARQLGGRVSGRYGASKLYRVNRSDDLDVSSAQYFVNSCLAPVLLLWRRIEPVADVLKGWLVSEKVGCSWTASGMLSVAMSHVGLCAPSSRGVHWIPPDLHGFYKWVFDALSLLNKFVRQVATGQRGSA